MGNKLSLPAVDHPSNGNQSSVDDKDYLLFQLFPACN